MNLWDVTIEELYQTAAENTQRLEKPKMRQVLQKLPVHFSIDKPVYNAVFDFLILKKLCHIHCRTLSLPSQMVRQHSKADVCCQKTNGGRQ